MEIAYTVCCSFREDVVMREWCRWLRDEHLADVVTAGALRAELICFVDEKRCEARYVFASREAFDRYERDHAPALRDEGLARFPLARGLTYSRSVGERIANA